MAAQSRVRLAANSRGSASVSVSAQPKPQPAWVKAIEDRPRLLKEAMARVADLPGHPFRFWNRQGDLEFVVSRMARIYVVAEPEPDDDSDDDDDMGDEEGYDDDYREFRKRRDFSRARRKALLAHGYRYHACDRLWLFTETVHTDRSLWNPDVDNADFSSMSRDYHDSGWKAMASAVAKAHETRLCACTRRLCAYGDTCYTCVLEAAGGPAPVFIDEMALLIMKSGGDWQSESEGAGSCAVCYKRKTRQMMFADCGHLACGECCAKLVKSKTCPHCRGPVTALQNLIYSA